MGATEAETISAAKEADTRNFVSVHNSKMQNLINRTSGIISGGSTSMKKEETIIQMK